MKKETQETIKYVIDKLSSNEFSSDDADWLAHLLSIALEDEDK